MTRPIAGTTTTSVLPVAQGHRRPAVEIHRLDLIKITMRDLPRRRSWTARGPDHASSTSVSAAPLVPFGGPRRTHVLSTPHR